MAIGDGWKESQADNESLSVPGPTWYTEQEAWNQPSGSSTPIAVNLGSSHVASSSFICFLISKLSD